MTTRLSPLICAPARARHPSTASYRYWPCPHLLCSISLVLKSTFKFTILHGDWMLWFCSTRATIIFFRKNHHELSWKLGDLMCKLDCGTVAERQVVIFSRRFDLVKPRAACGSRSAVRALSSDDASLRMLLFQVLCDHVVKLKKFFLLPVLQPFGQIPAFQDGDFTLYGEH